MSPPGMSRTASPTNKVVTGAYRLMNIASLFGWLVVAGLLIVAVWILVQPALTRRRHGRIAARPLSTMHERLLHECIPLYRRMPPETARRLRGQLNIFLHEKRFHGCEGFEVDDRVRIAIAANACLLRLQSDADCFPQVREILIYPTAFWVRHRQPDADGLVADQPSLLAGEAWQQGRVILSWEDVAATLAGDDSNVVVHEFAHQVDFENPGADGAPPMTDYSDWAAVFTDEFERLCETGSTVIDPYGAENPAEFFAVATETFVQMGDALAEHHPDLHRLLRDYYQIDTANMRASGGYPESRDVL